MAGKGGRALERYVRVRWREVDGKRGIRGLCAATGLTPEVLYSWFRGDNEPSLGALRTLAGKLQVERAELVAILDGYDLRTQHVLIFAVVVFILSGLWLFVERMP
jgi:hypothetical protein